MQLFGSSLAETDAGFAVLRSGARGDWSSPRRRPVATVREHCERGSRWRTSSGRRTFVAKHGTRARILSRVLGRFARHGELPSPKSSEAYRLLEALVSEGKSAFTHNQGESNMSTMIRKLSVVGVGALAVISASTPNASAQQAVCGDKIKEEIAKLLTNPVIEKSPGSEKALAIEAQIYAKYSACAADAVDPVKLPPEKAAEYCGKLSYLGNTGYEKMRCCGYDPQKQLFACPIDIVNPVGFGAPPFPGSYEHVLTCVNFGAGFQPAALDQVHLANAVSGSPTWEFAVIASAKGMLQQIGLNGQTLQARSILSWGLTPTSCSYKPYWGDVIDYQIRLDP